MKPISNKRGYALLDFIRLENEEAIDFNLHSPLIASLVVVEYQNKVLLVFDRYKQKWEVPGGHIEMNESPRACAVRELMEESGQSVNDLDFIGVVKIRTPDCAITYAAVYSCHLTMVSPFQANNEIEKTNYWDFRSHIGDVDEIDQYLAAVVLKH
jgi:8-oxo-dGTP diphosphatase